MIPLAVYQALPYLEAVALALAMSIAIMLQYRLAGPVSPAMRLTMLLGLTAVGALSTVLLTPRDLDERSLLPVAHRLMTDFDAGFAASRYLNLFVVSFGVAELLRGWLTTRSSVEHDPARFILYGLIAFYFGTILIQALGSAHPSFTYKSLYVPVIMLAVYYQRVDDIGRVHFAAKLAIFALTAGSLIGMVVKPGFVLHRPDPGVIPGIDYRLYGLTQHANTLGPMALIALLLELHAPTRWLWLRLPMVASAMTVLILAQSKTTWIAGLAMIVLVGLPIGLLPNPEPSKQARHFQRAVVSGLIVIGIAVVVATAFVTLDLANHVAETADVNTLTGRTQIWQLTLEGWRESLLFGYGRDIWGPDRMLKFGMVYAGQAHNQFVQTLGDSGLIGLVALLVLLGVLLRASLQSFASSGGLTLALWILVVARCVTEAPLRSDGVLTWPTFTLVLIVVTACHFVRSDAPVVHKLLWPGAAQSPMPRHFIRQSP